jgi:formylglycine-generating enzyme required for sulfatase activity
MIDRTEVTDGQYQLYVEAGSCDSPSDNTIYADSKYDDHPVVYVTWHNAFTR